MTVSSQTPASEAVLQRHLRYLLNENPQTPWVARLVCAGLPLHTGVITPLSALAEAWTIWSGLGGLGARQRTGRPLFRVADAIPTLSEPTCTDSESLRTIQWYVELRAQHQLEVAVTLVERARDQVAFIADGNKRAVACHEAARVSGLGDLRLPVYVVSLPDHVWSQVSRDLPGVDEL